MTATGELVLMRHAQSEFNAEGRFTGWINCGLTPKGEQEAQKAADTLREAGFAHFDHAFTSRLRRAADTAKIVIHSLQLPQKIILEADWRLNERHLGDLQGRSRADLIKVVGEDQVWRWRRGYEDRPPALAETDQRHPKFDELYADVDPARLPSSESLRDTRRRVVRFYNEKVLPRLNNGQRVLIVAHGFCLRALMMELSELTVAEVEDFELPTATPIICSTPLEDRKMEWRYLNSCVA